MSYTLHIVYPLHGGFWSFQEQIPEHYARDVRTATETMFQVQVLEKFAVGCAHKYFDYTMTPVEDELLHEIAIAIYGTIAYLRRPIIPEITTPTPEKPPRDEELDSAFELAQEGIDMKKDFEQRTQGYMERVKAHKEKFWSIFIHQQ